MTKYYSIVKVGFEYNDEIYSSGEGEYGQPVKLYRSQSSAMAECRALNLKELKESEIYAYGYDWQDIIGYNNKNEAAIMTMLMSYGFPVELDDSVDLTKLSETDLEYLADNIRLTFFKVVSVELVD